MNQDIALERLLDKMEEIIGQLDELGYPPIDIKLELKQLKPKFAGLAYTPSNRIELNSLYVDEHFEELLNTTLPHEMCHIYQKRYIPRAKQAHGPEWKRLMSSIGANNSTYHSMKISAQDDVKRKKTRYIYKNTVTGSETRVTPAMHKKLSVYGYGVNKIGQRFEFTGKTVTFY